jgi:phenylacetate-CoA ligase
VSVEFQPALRDPEALARLQLEQVNLVLARARETAFYAARHRGLPERLEDLGQLATFPTTTKSDVLADIAARPPYGTRLRVPLDRVRPVVTTSGTSGAGEEVYALDADDERVVYEMAARGFGWAGVTSESMVLNTLPLTTAAAGQWYYHGLRLLGATVLEVGTYPTERKLEYLERFRPDTLVGTPSYVLRLALDARRAGLDPAGGTVRRIVVAGESWSEDWMRSLEREWGARVFEQYGSTQRAMAWACPAGALTEHGRGVLHALSDHGLYEVIDPASGKAVAEGPGELVVTPFASSASPLVRFATGDRVTVVRSCECGRPGPLLAAGSVDRYDFMIKVRGVNLWPEALDSAVFGVGSVRDYEARVETDDQGRELLRVDLELETEDADVAQRVEQAVRRITGLGASVRTLPGNALTAAIEDRFRKRRRLHDRRKADGACA